MSIELVDTVAGITLRFAVDGTDAARGWDALSAVTAAHPRPDSKHRILQPFETILHISWPE